MTPYLVSILIPLYNSEKFISETINSCLNQTYKNIEIIIVDDGSSDKSLKIAKDFEKNHNNIFVYSQENSGACVARNKAFELSKGEYIQYLDADDLLSPNKIEEQIKLFEKFGNNIITSCTFVRFKDNISNLKIKKQKIDKDYNNPIDWLIDSWNGEGMGAVHSWLTPRHIIEKSGKWNENLLINQDGEFFCRVLLLVQKIVFCKNAIVYYRFVDKSVSKNYSNASLNSVLNSYELYIRHLNSHIKNPIISKALATNFSSFYSFFYPCKKELLVRTENNITKLGFKRFPLTGGRIFKIISFILGVKKATKFRYFIKNRL